MPILLKIWLNHPIIALMIKPGLTTIVQSNKAEMLISPLYLSRKNGFTLAELLISLAILGIIATFTISKVLYAQQSNKQTAMAKEAAAAISQAYQAYQLQNSGAQPTAITAMEIAQYLNYVSIDTSSPMDSTEGSDGYTCTSSEPCYRLHNGGVLLIADGSFCDSSSNSFMAFLFDPDGVYSGTTTGPSKSIRFNLYYNGRITDSSQQQAGDIMCNGGGTTPNGWGADPVNTWFNWK